MPSEIRHQRFNILLVEDNPADAHLFQAAMKEVASRGTIYWAATGKEGLAALERRDRFQDVLGFDIVVADLNETDRNIAALRANVVSGVFSVDNDLKVEGSS